MEAANTQNSTQFLVGGWCESCSPARVLQMLSDKNQGAAV